jgi:hypothetical protein
VLSFHQTIEESPTIIIVKFAIRFGLSARSSAEGEFGNRVVDQVQNSGEIPSGGGHGI